MYRVLVCVNVHQIQILCVCTYVNIPIADTDDCTVGVTVTVIGSLDVPPVILTTTSINPDDSEPVNCPVANPTANTSNITKANDVTFNIKIHLLVESLMIPTALSLVPAVIPGLSDGGTVNINSNSSGPSAISSLITGTLTLLIIIPLPNVAVSIAVLKSTPPVSQTLFSQHIIIHTMLPSADTDDCSDGVTVTSNGLADLPPTNSRFTSTNPVASEPVN